MPHPRAHRLNPKRVYDTITIMEEVAEGERQRREEFWDEHEERFEQIAVENGEDHPRIAPGCWHKKPIFGDDVEEGREDSE